MLGVRSTVSPKTRVSPRLRMSGGPPQLYWSLSKGESSAALEVGSPAARGQRSPRVWGKFDEVMLPRHDSVADPESSREAAMLALRTDGDRRTDAELVTIGDWLFAVRGRARGRLRLLSKFCPLACAGVASLCSRVCALAHPMVRKRQTKTVQ